LFNWKVELENLNVILATSTKTFALTALKTKLEANINPYFECNLHVEPVMSANLAAWANKVKEWDKCVQEQWDTERSSLAS
jgi:hypothetical protein